MADSEKRIIEHTASTEISNDDWLIKDSATGGTTKILASVLRTLLGGDNFASTYDSSLTYYTGNMCIYNGILYKCNAFSGTTGTFDSSKWTQVTITDYASKLLASDWRATSSYVKDDLVSYRGNIYRCASDSATVGTFVNTEWITANWNSIRIVLLRNNIAKEYDNSEIYNKGDLVFESPYDLCICKENGVTGVTGRPTFDTSKWITDGTISDALELVDEQIIENIAGEYDSEVEYSKDALCFKDGVLYIANADTTGTWDSTKWDATTIADIIANLRIDANDVVDVKVKGYSLVNSSKIAVLDSLTAQGSASGSIASFSDGSTHPMSKLEVGIEPQQDLHGYDHPWVGGAGKNKLNYDAWKGIEVVNGTAVYENNGVTLTSTKSDCYTAFGGWSADKKIPVSEGETIILSWEESTNQSGEVYIFPNGNVRGLVVVNNNASKQATYTVGSDVTFITFRFGVMNAGATISYKNIMVRKSGDATFEPYSNICPISGHTEANVSVSGVNVWDEEWEVGAINRTTGVNLSSTDAIRAKNFNRCKGGQSYYCKIANYGLYWMMIIWYDENQNYISGEYCGGQIVTSPNNATYFKVATNTNASSRYGSTYNNDISVNYPSTDTSYHAYNGHTYNVEFKDGSNPLTVYCVSLDVISGVLVVYRASVDLGDLTWTYSSSSGRSLFVSNDITDYKHTGSNNIPVNAICECFPIVPMSATFVNGQMGMDGDTTRSRTIICDNRYSNETDFKTAMNGVQLVYELATPLTIQLTPTQVKSLLGTNNVWADTGDVNEAVYTRDLNTTVNDIISRIEALENA